MTRQIVVELRLTVPDDVSVVVAQTGPAPGIPQVVPVIPDPNVPPPMIGGGASPYPAPPCPVHMVEMVWHPPGNGPRGAYPPSWRCPHPDCKGQTKWIREGA